MFKKLKKNWLDAFYDIKNFPKQITTKEEVLEELIQEVIEEDLQPPAKKTKTGGIEMDEVVECPVCGRDKYNVGIIDIPDIWQVDFLWDYGFGIFAPVCANCVRNMQYEEFAARQKHLRYITKRKSGGDALNKIINDRHHGFYNKMLDYEMSGDFPDDILNRLAEMYDLVFQTEVDALTAEIDEGFLYGETKETSLNEVDKLYQEYKKEE